MDHIAAVSDSSAAGASGQAPRAGCPGVRIHYRRVLRARRSPRLVGFTLVELMIVVAIVGVLAALAIYGVRKYIANAKTVEARNALGRMAKSASGAYARETMDPSVVLDPRATTLVVSRLCRSAKASVPLSATAISGRKYQSRVDEWRDAEGWTCLRFSMAEPQYFQYNYLSTGGGSVGATFVASARGDLNGDTNLSLLQMHGKIVASSGGGMEVFVSPNIEEIDPDE